MLISYVLASIVDSVIQSRTSTKLSSVLATYFRIYRKFDPSNVQLYPSLAQTRTPLDPEAASFC